MLSELRNAQRLSLREVAERMGCSHVAVSKLESSRNPGILTLKRYADAVGVPFLEVVDTAVKMSPKSYQNA